MGKLISAITVTLFSINAHALSGNFSDYAQYAKTHYRHISQKIEHFKASDFKDFNQHPDTTKYYQKDGKIKSVSKLAIFNNLAGKEIVKTQGRDRQYVMNDQSNAISRSLLLQNDAYNITHGISDQYVNCQKQDSCHTAYDQSQCTCNVSRHRQCIVTPKVTIEKVPYQVSVTYTGSITLTDNDTGTFELPESGVIKTIHISMHSNNVWLCHTGYRASINATYIATNNVECGHWLGDLSFSNTHLRIPVQNQQSIVFKLSGGPVYGRWTQAHYRVSLLVTHLKKHVNIVMENSCDPISPLCRVASTKCVIKGSTKIIDGVSVHQNCWKTQKNYRCGLPPNHSCDALMSKGCDMTDSQCLQTLSGVCISYHETMSCPKKQCPHNNVICGTHAFCMDGNCYEKKTTNNKDFGKDEAKLAAAAGSAGSISKDQHNLKAFSGHAMNCSLEPIGFLNCCVDHGWGKDIGLAKCSTEEKQLGSAREKGFAIKVGKYCSHHILGVCVSHRQSFCVFDGLLAKDVQEQGRKDQLDIGFGGAKSPDCRGITVSQLQQIDFSQIDFSNLEKSLKNSAHFPNQSDVEKAIVNKIKQQMSNQ